MAADAGSSQSAADRYGISFRVSSRGGCSPAAYKYVLDVSCIKSITDWLTARKRYVNAASRSRGEPSRKKKLNVRLIPAAVVPVLVLQPMTELSEPFSTRKP